MQGSPRFFYKSLRIAISISNRLMGNIIVQFHTPKGSWRTLDFIGHYSLSRTSQKVYVNSERLGYWLNQGAIVGLPVQMFLLAFCSEEELIKAG